MHACQVPRPRPSAISFIQGRVVTTRKPSQTSLPPKTPCPQTLTRPNKNIAMDLFNEAEDGPLLISSRGGADGSGVVGAGGGGGALASPTKLDNALHIDLDEKARALQREHEEFEKKKREQTMDLCSLSYVDAMSYRDFPLKPGADVFQWLAPAGKSRAGTGAGSVSSLKEKRIKMRIPATVVYGGGEEMWFFTDDKGFVNRGTHGTKWRSKAARRILKDLSPVYLNSLAPPERVAAIVKVPHWSDPQKATAKPVTVDELQCVIVLARGGNVEM